MNLPPKGQFSAGVILGACLTISTLFLTLQRPISSSLPDAGDSLTDNVFILSVLPGNPPLIFTDESPLGKGQELVVLGLRGPILNEKFLALHAPVFLIVTGTVSLDMVATAKGDGHGVAVLEVQSWDILTPTPNLRLLDYLLYRKASYPENRYLLSDI